MTAVHAQPESTPAPADPPRSLWGLCTIELHDRLWAARSVCIVRPGSAPPPDEGPGLLVLLGPRDLVDFSIAAAREELVWAKVDALRVRIVAPRARRHDEVVRAAPDGTLVDIKRIYSPVRARSASCWVTRSSDLARTWAASEPRGASRALRAHPLCRRTAALKLTGTVVEPDDEETLDAWLCRAIERMGRIPAVLPSVYHFQPGVWAHERSSIGRSVRFVGPALVGDGAVIPDGATVIGPVVLGDATGAAAAPPIDWTLVRAPFWNIVPARPGGSIYAASKRAFDIAVSTAALLGLALLTPLVLLAIYIEDGRPFFFAHTRQTLGGRNFPCLKFRTMVNGAESMKAELSRRNQADGPQFFIKDDPRLLRVGRWLRRFQIDELPQFVNVLLGHMSLVGPRPSPDGENQFCPAWRDARLSLRPGITGLWQVRRTRAPDTDFQEWIRYDLEYVQRRSWRLDLWIIAMTIRKVLFNG